MEQSSIQSADSFLRLLLYSSGASPSTEDCDPAVLRMLSDRAHEFVNEVVRAGVEGGGGGIEGGVGEERR